MSRPALALLVFLSLLPARASSAEPSSEAGVVEEAWALERDLVPRPTHADPALPGTFEDGLAPWAEALNASAARFKDIEDWKPLEASFDLDAPTPADWRAEVERSAALLDGALAATHRASARLPSGGRMGGSFADERPGILELQHLGRLALLDARLASERGDHGLALRRCADVLALSRDLSWGPLLTSLSGRTIGVRPAQRCFQFASRAPLPERRQFLEAVARIRAGWAPPSASLRHERLFGQLLFARRFGDEAREALPPALASVVKLGPEWLAANGLRDWLFGGLARKAIFRNMTRLMEVADAPPGEADPVIARIELDLPIAVRLAGMGDDVRGSSWLRMVRGLRGAQARMVLLHAALAASIFQEERGAVPRTWKDIVPSGAPIDPRTGRALALDLSPALRVRAEADAAREADELSLTVAER